MTSPLHKALAALKRLACGRPVNDINYGDIAAEAGLPWQTVRKLLGERNQLSRWLECGEPDGPCDSKGKIMESAARVFARKGYHGASLDMIASEAGLTKGAVYSNFQNKTDLFFALLDRHMKSHMADLPTRVEAANALDNPLDSLKLMLAGTAQHIEADPDWPRLYMEFIGQTRDAEINRRIGEVYQQSYALAGGILDQLQAAGRTNQTADTFTMAVFWTALIDGLVLASIANPHLIQLQELMPKIAELAWQGVGPQQSQNPSGDHHEPA